ncbi:DUF1830 domain-containing protein [Brunnivagina elsteri]|uniref:DUF1830 domain-containing protein n=1 Tax=Brunnivagina elsteri CCALA 953 TaxID=987040 RepID=A0A2A2TD04_9CYAN|nr:DUF1830 domain-containing protein [Calothrix elsteri]PAX51528.1 hypothetical protein CK510_24310 [Calothrix elsteri CCALA 953]
MTQILDSLPPEQSGKILCCYVNATSKIQVARISDVPNWYFERVVFPGQRLVFEAPRTSHLEIHTGMMASAIISDNILCDRLMVDDFDSDIKSENFDDGSRTSGDSINQTTMVSPIHPIPGETTKPLKIVGLA